MTEYKDFEKVPENIKDEIISKVFAPNNISKEIDIIKNDLKDNKDKSKYMQTLLNCIKLISTPYGKYYDVKKVCHVSQEELGISLDDRMKTDNMGINKQVLSIGQMNHLNELGLKLENTFLCWIGMLKHEFSKNPHTEYCIEINKGKKYPYNVVPTEYIPTLTFHEIFKLLPDHIICNNSYYELIINKNTCCVLYSSVKDKNILKSCFFYHNELKAIYKMLCWVIENKYLNIN